MILHQQHRKVSRYSDYFLCKDTISSVQHSNKVLYFLKSWLSTNHSTCLCTSEQFTSPTQYLFLVIYSSTNTRSGPAISTETKILLFLLLTHPMWQKTEFYTTIKDLIAEFKEYLEKSVERVIADQDAKVEKKPEKELHTLSLQVKYILSTQGEKSKIFSLFRTTYNEQLESTSNNKKISTKFEIART